MPWQVADEIEANLRAIEEMQLRLHHRAVVIGIGVPHGPVPTLLAHMAARGTPPRGTPAHPTRACVYR